MLPAQACWMPRSYAVCSRNSATIHPAFLTDDIKGSTDLVMMMKIHTNKVLILQFVQIN